MFGDKIQELLPVFEDTKIVVVKKIPNTATYVVQVPQIAKSINIDLLPKDNKQALYKPQEKPRNNLECDKTIECDVEVDKILSSNEKTESIDCQNQTSKSTSSLVTQLLLWDLLTSPMTFMCRD